MEVLKLINNGSKKLRDKNINSYKIDSEILLSEVLNQTREKILINLDKKIDTKKIGNFYRFIQRRSSREPIAYILKKKRVLEQELSSRLQYFDTETRNRVIGWKNSKNF